MGRDRGIGVRRGGLGANGYGGIEGAEWEFEWGLVLGDRGQPGMRSAEVNGGGGMGWGMWGWGGNECRSGCEGLWRPGGYVVVRGGAWGLVRRLWGAGHGR